MLSILLCLYREQLVLVLVGIAGFALVDDLRRRQRPTAPEWGWLEAFRRAVRLQHQGSLDAQQIGSTSPWTLLYPHELYRIPALTVLAAVDVLLLGRPRVIHESSP